MTNDPRSTTLLIEAARQGNPGAAERLFLAVYDELRTIAGAMLRGEKPGQTLQPTALVHEAYLKVTGTNGSLNLDNRRHLFGVFANAMRQILIDVARRKAAAKHGGGRERATASLADGTREVEAEDLVEIGAALDLLNQEDPAAGEIVRLKVFAGCTMDQIAELVGRPKRTVEREWTFARAWLIRHIEASPGA